MSTHTAGPWRAEPDVREYKGVKELTGWNVYAGERDEVVGCEGILSDGEANARLIAAAPELLEALRDVLPYAEACVGSTWRGNPPHNSVVTAARAVIAKATGSAA